MATTTSDSAGTVLRITRTFAAPVQRVYAAFTDAEMLAQWHAPGDYTVEHAAADVRMGGAYRITMKAPAKDITHTVVGIYQKVVPEQRLVYTWRWEDQTDSPETLVTVSFQANGAKTDLTILHERFPDVELRDKHNEGWCGCLENLDKALLLCDRVPGAEAAANPGPALVEFYLHQAEFAGYARREFMLGDVSDEESLWQPRTDLPPIAWHVAHLAYSEAMLFLGMCKGDTTFAPEGWSEWYPMGVDISAVASKLPPLSVVMPDVARLHGEVVAFVRTLQEDDLEKEMAYLDAERIPEFIRTPGDCLRTLALHEGHHNGEISLLRRLLNKQAPF
jgi:uncharacterized protein YndB with AHSA1/START domain